ncbi:MAG: type II secretion system protein GspG, partial [Bryobacteraceae bacterium]
MRCRCEEPGIATRESGIEIREMEAFGGQQMCKAGEGTEQGKREIVTRDLEIGDREDTVRIPSRESRIPSAAGITLIELLVVVTIIAMFAALVGPRLFRQVGRSRVTAARAQINSFQTALGAYKLDTGRFPTTE